jgi:hypothetical protein
MAATAIKTNMRPLKKTAKIADLRAEKVAAESAWTNRGHNELCKNLPMTDLAKSAHLIHPN